MKTYVSQMLQEKIDLQKKIEVLNTFIQQEPLQSTNEDQDILLISQLRAMELYNFILEQRISVELGLGNLSKDELDGAVSVACGDNKPCDHID